MQLIFQVKEILRLYHQLPAQVSHPFFGANPLQMASNKIFKGKIMISLPLAGTLYDTLELGTAAMPISAVGAVIHT